MAKKRGLRGGRDLGIVVNETLRSTGETKLNVLSLKGLSVEEIKRVFFDGYGIMLSNRKAKMLRGGGTVNLEQEIKGDDNSVMG